MELPCPEARAGHHCSTREAEAGGWRLDRTVCAEHPSDPSSSETTVGGPHPVLGEVGTCRACRRGAVTLAGRGRGAATNPSAGVSGPAVADVVCVHRRSQARGGERRTGVRRTGSRVSAALPGPRETAAASGKLRPGPVARAHAGTRI